MNRNLEPRTDGGDSPAPRRPGINCTEANDLIPALALGAIDTGERHALQLHCDFCPSCAQALALARRTVSFLPFAAPSAAPSPQAKHALFARIEQDGSAAVAAASASPHVDLPHVDNPSDKRRRPSRARSAGTASLTASASASPLSQLASGRISKFTAAPLALALVLISVYALQNGRSNDGPNPLAAVPTPTAVSVTSGQNAANTYTVDTLSDMGTNGAILTQPIIQTAPLSSNSNQYSYRGMSRSSPTESTRSVAPKVMICEMRGNGTGSYNLSVSGVVLPADQRNAAIYLVEYDGTRSFVGTVAIDQSGSGATTFTLEKPMTEYATLLIGPNGSGANQSASASGMMPFSLASNSNLLLGTGATS